MTKRCAQPRRHRMRKAARMDSARAWIDSGAAVSIRAYAKRYGVDNYTAYDELTAIGVSLSTGDAQWAQRPPSIPRRRAKQELDDGIEWFRYGDEIMFVVGYTSGGAPYGYVQTIEEFETGDWFDGSLSYDPFETDPVMKQVLSSPARRRKRAGKSRDASAEPWLLSVHLAQ